MYPGVQIRGNKKKVINVGLVEQRTLEDRLEDG